MADERVWIGSSESDIILRQKIRPSEADTRQPLTTFQRSFISSLDEGEWVVRGSSDIPRGKRPGEEARLMGLWRGDRSLRLGE